jgi:hypothetical protein
MDAAPKYFSGLIDNLATNFRECWTDGEIDTVLASSNITNSRFPWGHFPATMPEGSIARPDTATYKAINTMERWVGLMKETAD